MDIRNLIKIDPVKPTETTSNPIEFVKAEFYGGQVQVAPPRQEPRRSNEEAQYLALAQIAQGVGEGLQNFGSIAKAFDDRAIRQVESKWEEIDANKALTPEEKITQFNDVLNRTTTTFSGEAWKSSFVRRVVNTWGEDFSNEIAASMYEKSLKKNAENPLMGPPQDFGPIVLRETLDEFVKENPSLAGTPYIEGLFAQANEGMAELQAQSAVDSIKLGLATQYTLTPQVKQGLLDGSYNIVDVERTDPIVAKSLELALSSDKKESFVEQFNDSFNEGFIALVEQVEDGPTKIKLIQDGLSLRDKLSTDMWDFSRAYTKSKTKVIASSMLDTATYSFKASPTEDGLRDLSNRLFVLTGDMNYAERSNSVLKYIEAVQFGLESGKIPTESGASYDLLPPAEKARQLKATISSVMSEEKLLLASGAQFQTWDAAINAFRGTKEGQAMSARVFEVSKNAAKAVENINAVRLATGDTPLEIGEAAKRYINDLALSSGVAESAIEKLFIIKNDDGTVSLRTQSPREIFMGLSASEKAVLGEGGITPNSLIELQKDFVSGLAAVTKGSSGSSRSAGAAGGEQLKTITGQEYPTPLVATGAILKDTSLVDKASQVASNPLANSKEASDARAILQAASDMESSFQLALQVSSLSTMQELGIVTADEVEALNARANQTATQSQLKLLEEKGIDLKVSEGFKQIYGVTSEEIKFLDTPINSQTIRSTKWVDEQGSLTPEGRLLGLKLQFKADLVAKNSDIAGRDEFYKDLKDRITSLSSVPLESDPALLYSTLYTIKGIGNSRLPGIPVFEQRDNQMINLVTFISTHPIPPVASLDRFNRVYRTGLDLALEAVTLPEQGGVMRMNLGSGDSPATRGMGMLQRIATGDYSTYSNVANTGTASPNTQPSKNEGVIAFVKELGIPINTTVSSDLQAQEGYQKFREMVDPILPPGIPTNDNSTLVVPIPVVNQTKLEYKMWNQLTPEEKLTYTVGRLLENNARKTQDLIALPYILNYTMDRADLRGTSEERFEAIKSLFRSGTQYAQMKEMTPDKLAPSFVFNNDANFVLTYNSFLPEIYGPRRNELSPNKLVQDVLQQFNGELPNIDLSESEVDNWWGRELPGVRPDAESVAEDDLDYIYNVVRSLPEGQRKGLANGLDPADQFVVGALSLPATPQNIRFVSNIFGLSDAGGVAQTGRDGYSVYEVLTSSGSSAGIELNNILKDSNLGLGNKNKIRFDTNLDKTKPVLVVGSGNNTRVFQINEKVPALPPDPYKSVRIVRFSRTLRMLLDSMQRVEQ